MMYLLPLYMSFTARMSGGGLLWNDYIKIDAKATDGKSVAFVKRVISSFLERVPELAFAFPYGAFVYCTGGSLLWSIVAWLWSFVMMETGHGTFYGMDGYHDHNRENPNKPRVQTLERIFRPLYLWAGGDIMRPLYSWYMMAIKGTLIALPLGLISVISGIGWAASYYAGHKIEKEPSASELISGTWAGTIILMVCLLRKVL